MQGLSNTVQIFALILSTLGKCLLMMSPIFIQSLQYRLVAEISKTSGGNYSLEQCRLESSLLLLPSELSMFRPNVLALNFASTVAQPLIFLVIFMAIAAGLLYHFYRSTYHYDRYNTTEGLQAPDSNNRRWSLIIVTFLLTVIYLPLTTMAVHVIVWSQDLWVVPNPYNGTTSRPPVVPPLGPASEYRSPLDFCWTTTMNKNQVNYAPIVIVMSVVVILFVRYTMLYVFRLS